MEIFDDAVLARIEPINAVCFEFSNFGETKGSEFSSVAIYISDSASWSS